MRQRALQWVTVAVTRRPGGGLPLVALDPLVPRKSFCLPRALQLRGRAIPDLAGALRSVVLVFCRRRAPPLLGHYFRFLGFSRGTGLLVPPNGPLRSLVPRCLRVASPRAAGHVRRSVLPFGWCGMGPAWPRTLPAPLASSRALTAKLRLLWRAGATPACEPSVC